LTHITPFPNASCAKLVAGLKIILKKRNVKITKIVEKTLNLIKKNKNKNKTKTAKHLGTELD